MTNIFTCMLVSCALLATDTKEPYIELPRYRNVNISIDTNPLEKAWTNATKLSNFINPWNPSANQYTETNLLWNGKELYFYFIAHDKEVILIDNIDSENRINREDRVEFFISPDMPLTEYYGIEMDALGRVMDYKVKFYRKFYMNWTVGKHLRLKGRLTPEGYCLEGCIDKKLLKELTNGQKTFYLGAYRADYNTDVNGKKKFEWLCIKDPKTSKPDFHVDGTFIKVTLE